jgi:glutaredoxin
LYNIYGLPVSTWDSKILFHNVLADHVNKKTNQQNIGTIKSSNLCAEILEYSDDKETAVCNLASIALNMFVEKYPLDVEITMYTKSNCKYCKLAKMLLRNHNIEWEEIELEQDQKISDILNNELKTVPQILMNNKHIGGYTELKAYLQPRFNFDKLKNL